MTTDALTQIRTCKHLYLDEISEPSDNELRVVVSEALMGEPVDPKTLADDPHLQDLLAGAGARAIVRSAESRVFVLSWSTYVAYSVRNESFVSADKYEEFEGRLLLKFGKSRYLDFVAAATLADSDYPGPLQHWGLACLNHIVDIVSIEKPVVTMTASVST